MKFKNKTTGVILTPNNEFALEQLKKNANYEEVKMEEVKHTEEPIKKSIKKLDK